MNRFGPKRMFAYRLRALADRTGKSEYYRKAAAEFRAMGMVAAAAKCDEKARVAERSL